jgi:hypothetical protein
VVKGTCALVACLIYTAGGKKTLSGRSGGPCRRVHHGGGLFWLCLGEPGAGLAAAASVPGNIIQVAFGLVAVCFY